MIGRLSAGVESLSADGGKLPRYETTYSGKLDFGQRIQIPYILDSADVDGDGYDDFSVGAKIEPPRGENRESTGPS